jgi:hypothetical protein
LRSGDGCHVRLYVYTQTIRHRDYFINHAEGEAGESRLSNRMLALSFALLLISLLPESVAAVGAARKKDLQKVSISRLARRSPRSG